MKEKKEDLRSEKISAIVGAENREKSAAHLGRWRRA
jgi:hypothetical protein